MPKYTNFEDFSRDLFVFHIIPSNRKNYEPSPLVREASKILDYFSQGHKKHFQPGFIMNQFIHLETDQQFYQFAIPKCLHLVDSDRYFYSLVLIACYLKELLNYIKNNRLCYRFHFTAYKCFLVVFKREFESDFDECNGLKGLGEYFELVKARVEKQKGSDLFEVININSRLCKRVSQLIENCNNHTGNYFVLNEYECSLFGDDDNKAAVEEYATDDENYDPINLKWPPCGALASAVRQVDRDVWGFYVKLLVVDAARKAKVSPKTFYNSKMMRNRKCPCCGVRCRMLFRKLFKSHLALGLQKTYNGTIL